MFFKKNFFGVFSLEIMHPMNVDIPYSGNLVSGIQSERLTNCLPANKEIGT